MAITFSCACGKMLRVADEHAGKKVKCPQCQQVSVAEAPPQFEVVEDDEPPPKPRAVAKAVSKSSDVEVDDDDRPRRKKRRDDDDDEDDDERASRKRRRRDDDDDDDDEEEDRPRRKKPRTKKSKKKQQSGAFATEKSIANGGVAVGLLVMLGAVVWFVIGFMNDRIFIYPPILFVVGLVAVIKGMLGIGGGDDE